MKACRARGLRELEALVAEIEKDVQMHGMRPRGLTVLWPGDGVQQVAVHVLVHCDAPDDVDEEGHFRAGNEVENGEFLGE